MELFILVEISRDGRYIANVERKVCSRSSVNEALGKLFGSHYLNRKAQLAYATQKSEIFECKKEPESKILVKAVQIYSCIAKYLYGVVEEN